MTPEQIADCREIAARIQRQEELPTPWSLVSVAAIHIVSLCNEIERLQPLASFGEKMLDTVKECVTNSGLVIDAETAADVAVVHRLMQWVAYDPAIHEGVSSEYEPGDMIYYWGPSNDT